MSTMLGKSAGIALLLAALIALLATGVFSPGGVLGQDNGEDDEVPAHQINAGTDGARFALTYGNSTENDPLELSPAFTPGRLSYDALYDFENDDVDAMQGRVTVAVRAGTVNTTTEVTIESVDGASVSDESAWSAEESNDSRLRVVVSPDPSDDDGSESDIVGALIKVKVEAADGQTSIYSVRVKQKGAIVNTTEAGATARVTIKAKLDAEVGDQIVLGMKGFVLPDEIDPDDVRLNDGEKSQNPDDVVVGSDKITLTFGKFDPEQPDSEMVNMLDDEEVTVTISSRAGVKTPTKAGTYTVTINSEDGADDEAVDAKRYLTVIRSIKISPTSAGKGTSVTVTGRGFSNGSLTVFRDLGDLDVYAAGVDEVLGQATVTKGAFSFQTSALKANSTIQAIDSNGELAEEGKAFTLKESIKVTPTEAFPDEEITIELVDWGETGSVDQVRFGGVSGIVETATGSRSESGDKFTINVPTGVRLGSLKVEVLVDGTSEASATITVQAQTLNISPITAVQGQEITITGSGFGENKYITSLTFGGGDNVYAGGTSSTFPRADSNGNVTITAEVPNNVTAGDREVKITAENRRSGTATLNVPKASLTVSPSESLRGTTITITGTGFPADDLIQILYEEADGSDSPVTTQVTDTTGNFTVDIKVPSYAPIGETQDVTADPQRNTVVDSVTADHSTPKPTMTLSPTTASPGQTISISGKNFAGFALVSELVIHDRDAKPVPVPDTEADGSINMTGIKVPQLDPGDYIVKMVIAGKTVTTFLKVTDAPVSTDPADVFEPLTTDNNLVVVWRYDNAAASWASYSPTAPAALNDLTAVTTGTIVWIQVTAAVADFHGQALVAGWNLITLR